MRLYPTTDLPLHLFRREAGFFKNRLLEYLYPTRCLICERLGALLCEKCRVALPSIDQDRACRLCGAPLGHVVCTECTTVYERTRFPFTAACCALEFDASSRRLILGYKDGGERRAAPLLAGLIVEALPRKWLHSIDLITWIPADDSALKRRGFDHMELIACSVAGRIGRPSRALLIKHDADDQRLLGRANRRRNMQGMFSYRERNRSYAAADPSGVGSKIKQTRILLLDDVFTTGATLTAATEKLLGEGASEVRVATVCRVW